MSEIRTTTTTTKRWIVTVDICAHFNEHNGECLFAQRNWSETCKPERCVGCPTAVKEAP